MPQRTCAPPEPRQLDLLAQPVDDDTAVLLDVVAGDPIHERDRAVILDAVHTDARAHGGSVVPDRVRDLLTSDAGLQVNPRVLSSMYSALTRAGVLEVDGWTTSQDTRGGNAGKPCRTYRLAADL